MIKGLIGVFVLFSCSLSAKSLLLKNEGIIDIGHREEATEIVVPKEKIIREPNIDLVENKIVYQERDKSPLYDCETDFINTETCTQDREICPTQEEYQDGYSVKHNVNKLFTKMCPFGTVKSGEKCYQDSNNDGTPDYLKKINYEYLLSNNGSSSPAGWGGLLSLYHISVGNYQYKFYAEKADNYKVRIQADNYSTIHINNNKIHSDTSDDWREEKPKYINLNKGEHTIKISAGNYDGPHGVAVAIYDSSNSLIWNTRKGQLIEYNDCKIGFMEDGDFCYILSECPKNTTEQGDGSCKLEYDWYEYKCPTDTNEYSATWSATDQGGDCGSPTCTNSPNPPTNNCVRAYYTCPINSNLKCGKTLNTSGICEDGYVWNSNRCERVESYCGDSFYNSTLDVCQDITEYQKLCPNQDQTYNPSTDECEASRVACTTGEYSSMNSMCQIDFVPECFQDGYVYNPLTEICENSEAPICPNGYTYDGEDVLCIGQMTMCGPGHTYNESLKKCEMDACTIEGVRNNGTMCQTDILCDGTFSNGICIPNTIQP